MKTGEDATVELETSVFGGGLDVEGLRELSRLASRCLGGCRPWRRVASATPWEPQGGREACSPGD